MNNITYKWWDNPVLSLEEYKYLFGSRWWNDNILSLKEYYAIEKEKRLLNMTDLNLSALHYLFKRR